MSNRYDRIEDDMRAIWDAKYNVQSPSFVAARSKQAAKRLHDKGNPDPSMDEITAERRALEEERFQLWYMEKQANGFANT